MATLHKRKWLNGDSIHEGFPIYFRRPELTKNETENLKFRFPQLMVIEHKLAVVKNNGLPESEYNLSLLPLDDALLTPFRDEAEGITALVETFAGRRTYYVYVGIGFDMQSIQSRISRIFPDEIISWEIKDDANWKVFDGYTRDFKFA